MTTKLIDLSQEIYQGMPCLSTQQQTVIFQNISHDVTKQKLGFEFATNGLILNEHVPTHSDAIYEYDPEGQTIDEMDLDSFYGPAICLDVSTIPAEKFITKRDLKEAMKASSQKIEEGDIVLLHTGHYERSYGTEEWFTSHTGLNYQAAKWLAELGVKNIGVDAPSIDQSNDRKFSGHRICENTKLRTQKIYATLKKLSINAFCILDFL
ncbi:metal-dependent hydrolase [Halalkalibacter wakoensis JCM 9140]|uniref:Metal-dependent hydrolase n=1 Tax=Halalkalibacter wakoensis JCM 9140 TaxID=1236970 RepID=W4Q856_9BACI|nr:cyclase family protein [Halalkalibacter wakoensis]GAE27868.1 metal-dependent hydrolase [Halalkalibacter wakoensis JCM 9140]